MIYRMRVCALNNKKRTKVLKIIQNAKYFTGKCCKKSILL